MTKICKAYLKRFEKNVCHFISVTNLSLSVDQPELCYQVQFVQHAVKVVIPVTEGVSKDDLPFDPVVYTPTLAKVIIPQKASVDLINAVCVEVHGK